MHSPSPALPPVAFIGGGNMARALIGGMVRGGTPAASIHVSEPYAPNREGLAAEFGVAVTEDNAAAASKAAVWVLATKPQVLGLLLVLAGAAIELRGNVDIGMLILTGVFTLVTAPVIGQRVGQLAYREGNVRDDLLTVDEGRNRPHDDERPHDESVQRD